MDKKIYGILLRLINSIMEKESAGWSKKRGVVLDKNSSFMESLEVDSLLALAIVSKIEKRFGIKFQEEDFVHFDNMQNIVTLIERKIKKGKYKNLPKKLNIKAATVLKAPSLKIDKIKKHKKFSKISAS